MDWFAVLVLAAALFPTPLPPHCRRPGSVGDHCSILNVRIRKAMRGNYPWPVSNKQSDAGNIVTVLQTQSGRLDQSFKELSQLRQYWWNMNCSEMLTAADPFHVIMVDIKKRKTRNYLHIMNGWDANLQQFRIAGRVGSVRPESWVWFPCVGWAAWLAAWWIREQRALALAENKTVLTVSRPRLHHRPVVSSGLDMVMWAAYPCSALQETRAVNETSRKLVLGPSLSPCWKRSR